MKKFLPFLLFLIGSFLAKAQLNLEYVSNLDYPQTINDIWGYAAPDGTEYALVGTNTGTSIVSLADPANPVELFFIPGANTLWRDIKTWNHYAYVTCDGCGAEGLGVIDLSDLPNSADHYFLTSLSIGALGSCHNIWIDEFGYAYLSGCTGLNSGGPIILDCATDPQNPVYAGMGNSVYAHDAYTAGNKMYSSEIYAGQFGIYDVTDKSNVVELGSHNTQYEFTHNTWLSDDGNYLFTTDEQPNAPIGSYDVSDPADIKFLDSYAPFATLGDGVIPHNVHVWQNWLIVSYYTDGCIIIDATYPDNLVEVGNFDTYIPVSTGFQGVWGAYPFLPSGLVLVTDRGNGLFVLQPNYVQAGYLEGLVTDFVTEAPIADAYVELLSTITFTNSDALGEFKTGIATGGEYIVRVTKADYFPAEIPVTLVNGEITAIEVELIPLASFPLTGTVIDALSNNPIPNAAISVVGTDITYQATADVNGVFEIPAMFVGTYDVFAGSWGHQTNVLEAQALNENNNNLTIALTEGLEDVFAVDLGWTVSINPVASSNAWERGTPLPASISNIPVTVSSDVPSDIGNFCYLTGNNSDAIAGLLINATTTLSSPLFDLSNYTQPMINFYEWFVNMNFTTAAVGDRKLIVRLNNGTEEVVVYESNSQSNPLLFAWSNEVSINVNDFLTPTATMTFSVEVSSGSDTAFGTEAAIDHWRVWDDLTIATNDPTDDAMRLWLYPNPSQNDFVVNYELYQFSTNANVSITNTLGQLVQQIPLEAAKGSIRFGAELPGGLYFVQIQDLERAGRILKVVKE
jgi:choice-of-anchor B domain-containing protein